MEPLFLTHKVTVRSLRSVYNTYDFQLRDHLLTADDLYLAQCRCYHTHKKRQCRLVTSALCEKCKTVNCRYLDYKSLLFHPAAEHNRLAKCCTHVHEPPCGRCLGCRTTSTCIVQFPFECNYTTDATCVSASSPTPHFTANVEYGDLVCEHVYNTRTPTFYICKRHTHVHAHDGSYAGARCFVQTKKCCENAVLVTEFDSSFVITTVTPLQTRRGSGYKEDAYVIFDPSLWSEQSANHFVSFLRAVVNIPGLVAERYRRFEACHFRVSNMKQYKSGKQSIMRTAVTGFETKGVYQTATISCTLPNRTVLIPQKIYDLMVDEYDLSLVAVKRDPSLKQTCMFVCKAERNADPDVDTLVISDTIAKPMNQDQDGDKNGVYVLPKRWRNYDRLESFLHRLARLELAVAYESDKTLIATPRHSFSEHNLLVMYRQRAELEARSDFYRRTYGDGVEHMIDAGCGYLRSEYEDFCRLLLEINRRDETFCVTLDDLARRTDALTSIVESGAKGHSMSIDALFENLLSERTLYDLRPAMVEQMNRYITSSQDIRLSGRNQFVSLYAGHDLIAMLGCVYVNKRFYADYRPFASVGALMFNEGSLNEFIKDLRQL